MIWPMGADTSHHYSHDDAQVHHLAETRTCTYRQGFVCGVHVGECRVLQLQAAEWRPITSEHTLFGMLRAQPQIEMPDIDPEQSKRIVTRVVGLTETVEVDTFRFPMVSRASVILCSPGAWAPLDPDATGGAIPDCPSESAMVAFALDAYRRAGELDNFTTIYATFRRRG